MPNTFAHFATATKSKAKNYTTVPIDNGLFLILTDTKQLCYDFGGTRLFLGDIEEIETEEAREAIVSPLDKFYFVREDTKLWRYIGGEWHFWADGESASEHIEQTILSTNGVHGLKYNAATGVLSYLDANDDWQTLLVGDSSVVLATLLSSGWTGNEQTVTVSGVDSATNGTAGLTQDITTAAYEAACDAALRVSAQGTDSVTITAMGDVPSVDIPIAVIIFPQGSAAGGGGSWASAADLGDVSQLTTTNKSSAVEAINELDNGKVDKVSGKGLSTEDFTTAEKNKLGDIEAEAQKNVQADWEEDDDAADSYIQNKPTLGTAAAKNSTDHVQPNSHDLVESIAVYSAINNALSSIYTPRGDLACASLTSALLIEANVGNVYQMTDSGTTTALFLQGAGQTINIGDNVGIIKAGANTYLFNLMGNAFDLHDYQTKALATAIAGASTVEGALSALDTVKLSGMATILTSADDIDALNTVGVYAWASNSLPANVPDNIGYCIMFHVRGAAGGNNEQQYILKGSGGNLIMRSLATVSPRVWGEWHDLTPVDSITDGNMRPATSNAVYNAIQALPSTAVLGAARMHANIYRGKYLGSSVTAEQYAAISAGTFDDLYIGDYWTIGGVNWRIVDFDYWYGKGDTACSTHHVVIVPDTNLYTAKMNDSNVTTGGYIGSQMYTANLANAKTTINSAFGSAHILSKRELFTNTVSNGIPTAGAWVDSTVDLMNEINVYGSYIFTPANNGTTIPYIYTIDTTQFALFRLDPTRICNRSGWGLRDVVSAACFAVVAGYGNASFYGASNANGVRPAFAIK